MRWIQRLLTRVLPAVTVTVLVAGDERQVIEVYLSGDAAARRAVELRASGFSGATITRASRRVLLAKDPARPWGWRWKRAVGWTR